LDEFVRWIDKNSLRAVGIYLKPKDRKEKKEEEEEVVADKAKKQFGDIYHNKICLQHHQQR